MNIITFSNCGMGNFSQSSFNLIAAEQNIREPGVVHIQQKTPAEVLGEYVLRPLVDKVIALWNKMPSIPFLNLPAVEARSTVFQNHIILDPGKDFYVEATRKIALCKRHPGRCNYHGPNLHVSLMKNDNVVFSGEFGGKQSWTTDYGRLKLHVINNGNQQAAMYVHAEDW